MPCLTLLEGTDTAKVPRRGADVTVYAAGSMHARTITALWVKLSHNLDFSRRLSQSVLARGCELSQPVGDPTVTRKVVGVSAFAARTAS